MRSSLLLQRRTLNGDRPSSVCASLALSWLPEHDLFVSLMSLKMYHGSRRPLAPDSSWLGKRRSPIQRGIHLLIVEDAGPGYRDGVAAHILLSYAGGDCSCPLCQAAAPALSEGVPQISARTLGPDQTVHQIRSDTISPCQSGVATLAMTQSQSRIVLGDCNRALTVGLDDKSTAPVLAPSSTASNSLRTSLMHENAGYADVAALKGRKRKRGPDEELAAAEVCWIRSLTA